MTSPLNDEFENALAWYAAAPARWLQSARSDLTAAAEWIWVVVQGDFAEEQSGKQIAAGTIISMIPFVDQLCDIRDFVANVRKINQEPHSAWPWFALVLTLIGLFPTLGSLLKGCFKVMFASLRKTAYISGAIPKIEPCIEGMIQLLNKFLNTSAVQKTLTALKIHNPYKYLAGKLRALAAEISASKLMAALDVVKAAAEDLLNLVKRWGGATLAEEVNAILKGIDGVRRKADSMIGQAIKPVQEAIDALARRLEIDADRAYRAHLATINPHVFAKISEADERAALTKAVPNWCDKNKGLTYRPLRKQPTIPAGWADIVGSAARGRHPLDDAYKTFHTVAPITLPPGTKLYRVIDPKSLDNSICWMSEHEFLSLRTKDDWRRRFAVWANWNSNGEFVTYVVPNGPGLNVWEGVTASQLMQGTTFSLEGGARQIVVNPTDIVPSMLSKRRGTNWGYDDIGHTPSLLGVPVQTNNIYSK